MLLSLFEIGLDRPDYFFIDIFNIDLDYLFCRSLFFLYYDIKRRKIDLQILFINILRDYICDR
jgi:hypothetical protein